MRIPTPVTRLGYIRLVRSYHYITALGPRGLHPWLSSSESDGPRLAAQHTSSFHLPLAVHLHSLSLVFSLFYSFQTAGSSLLTATLTLRFGFCNFPRTASPFDRR
ncbi:hypothetical protein M405DRAFT_139745 [Rhizopogon salebrosus TDB-379]|nr:hypothetical protein M405DRAFT_139745 [Rhizopogon salebrosus TDB-379]